MPVSYSFGSSWGSPHPSPRSGINSGLQPVEPNKLMDTIKRVPMREFLHLHNRFTQCNLSKVQKENNRRQERIMSRIRNKHRSRLNSMTMTAAAVTLAMLAGCGIQDKSDEVIVQAASSLEQSVIHAADKWGQRSKEAGLFREISTYQQVGKA